MKVFVLTMIILLTSCSSTYQFGDISKGYCAAVTPEGRQYFKDKLHSLGIHLPFDYCELVGLVDVMAETNE